jgi:hypothetical protein
MILPINNKKNKKNYKIMACLIDAGLVRECNYFLAGISKVYIANFADITYDTDGMNTVTGITSGTSAFFVFDVNPESASAASEMQVANGRRYFQQTVNFSNDSTSAAAIEALEKLGLSKTTVIVETKGGASVVFGSDGGLDTNVLSFNTGAAAGDVAGFTVTLGGVGKKLELILGTGVTVPVTP